MLRRITICEKCWGRASESIERDGHLDVKERDRGETNEGGSEGGDRERDCSA